MLGQLSQDYISQAADKTRGANPNASIPTMPGQQQMTGATALTALHNALQALAPTKATFMPKGKKPGSSTPKETGVPAAQLIKHLKKSEKRTTWLDTKAPSLQRIPLCSSSETDQSGISGTSCGKHDAMRPSLHRRTASLASLAI